MARAATVVEPDLEPDRLEGLPLPREQLRLFGHGHEEQLLLEAYRSGRMHHGWIFGGLKGIGKATLAFRLARFVLANPDPSSPAVLAAKDLSVDPSAPTVRRIGAGAHANLLHLRRPWDDKAKRFKTEWPVDTIRETVDFFGTTAGEGGWRVAIVDPADDMNASAANALLKILEEPPPRSLFLVITNHPGRLLPTIRSRCRKLTLTPLTEAQVRTGLDQLGLGTTHAADAIAAAAALSEGSIRRAVLLLELGGVALSRTVETLTAGLPRLDLKAVHALADIVVAKGADDVWEMGIEFLVAAVNARALAAIGTDLARAARWSALQTEILARVATADALNLDRKSVVLWIFRALAEAAR